MHLGVNSGPGNLNFMDHDKHLQRHLDLCRRIYLRMVAEGTWPPTEDPDSPEPEDVVESENTNTDL